MPGPQWRVLISDVPDIIARAIRELRLVSHDEPLRGAPLSGGVSCDIWRVDLATGPVCAKRALPKLRVAEDWFAPTSRIDLEAAYYRYANGLRSGASPAVLGHNEALGVLVTEFLPPSSHSIWKDDLKDGIFQIGPVRHLADQLRDIHDSSHKNIRVKSQFYRPDLIHELRLSPYFLASAQVHPDLEAELSVLVHMFESHCEWLVHGDLSPKNILFGPEKPVILDAECANFGDAAFDIAFCVSHLFLKATWMPHHTPAYRQVFDAFTESYFAKGRDDALEARAAQYLAGLLLARIDGKSPVEYITTPSRKGAVRDFARTYLKQPLLQLSDLADRWYPLWAEPISQGKQL